MSDLLLDTHALVWYLARSTNLTDAARSAIKSSLAAGETLYISAVSLAEVLYLEEKGRLSSGTLANIISEITRSGGGLAVVPIVMDTIEAMSRVPRHVVPDLPDRLIAATALQLGLPLVTADHKIQAVGLPVIPCTIIWYRIVVGYQHRRCLRRSGPVAWNAPAELCHQTRRTDRIKP